MSKVGRNAPCPCGSGKKYKRCCIGSNVVPISMAREDEAAAPPDGSIAGVELPPHLAEAFPGLQQQLDGRSFGSVEELQQVFGAAMGSRNERALDDFHGLTPTQMRGMLYAPFEDNDDYRLFVDLPADLSHVPFVRVFLWLAEELGEGGVKATATGNLPRKLCNAVMARWADSDAARELWPDDLSVRTEPDFMELHAVRVVAEQAGLLRKYKGKFVLTKKAGELLRAPGHGGLYRALFEAYVGEFNWCYRTRAADAEMPQRGWLFWLYLLSRHGDTERDSSVYSNWFADAFPTVLDDFGSTLRSPRESFELMFRLMAIGHFAGEFGLVAQRLEVGNLRDPLAPVALRKTPLLDAVFALR